MLTTTRAIRVKLAKLVPALLRQVPHLAADLTRATLLVSQTPLTLGQSQQRVVVRDARIEILRELHRLRGRLLPAFFVRLMGSLGGRHGDELLHGRVPALLRIHPNHRLPHGIALERVGGADPVLGRVELPASHGGRHGARLGPRHAPRVVDDE